MTQDCPHPPANSAAGSSPPEHHCAPVANPAPLRPHTGRALPNALAATTPLLARRSYLRGGDRGGGGWDGAGKGRPVELWERRRTLVCQQAGGEGGTAHSPQHPTPVGNGVLVTGVDPCEGERWVRAPRPLPWPGSSWASAGLRLSKGGWYDGQVSHALQRGWSQPAILLSKGIYSLAPAPFLFAPCTPT